MSELGSPAPSAAEVTTCPVVLISAAKLEQAADLVVRSCPVIHIPLGTRPEFLVPLAVDALLVASRNNFSSKSPSERILSSAFLLSLSEMGGRETDLRALPLPQLAVNATLGPATTKSPSTISSAASSATSSSRPTFATRASSLASSRPTPASSSTRALPPRSSGTVRASRTRSCIKRKTGRRCRKASRS